ncbi:MAG: hypothetical protein JXR25_15515, partial [Pontiellaceae bacterium]|nr:hypothetical protein [Pontiellaceae bacterium]MBN2786228.1 hypothetical protein [Pontiellaceae bacterium]
SHRHGPTTFTKPTTQSSSRQEVLRGTLTLHRQNGFIWIATPNGAARYDGTTFDVFRTRTHAGLANNRICRLYEDACGTLYLGHSDGSVSIRTTEGFQAVTLPDGWLGSEIVRFHESGDTVWAVNAFGAFLMVGHGGRDLDEGELPVPDTDALLSPGGWTTRDDTVVFMEDQVVLRSWGPTPWIIKDQPIVFRELENGDIVAGSKHGGVFILHPDGSYSQISEADGIASSRILSLSEDSEGGIWAGTISGLSRIEIIPVQSLTDGEQLRDVPFLTISSMTPASGGGVFIGTNKGLLFKIKDDALVRVGPAERTEEVVRTLLETSPGNLWFGEAGIFLKKIEGDGARLVSGGAANADNWVLLQDPAGTIWTAGQLGVWKQEGPSSWRCVLDEANGISDVRCMVAGRDGSVWIGMKDNGLAEFKPDGALRHYTTADGLPGNYISALHYDAETGSLWVGACGDGLSCLREEQIQTVDIGADIIYSILKDGIGRFWFLSEKGLLVLSREALIERMESGGESGEMIVLGVADGIKHVISVVHGLSNACRTEDGRIWIASEKSVEVVNPDLVSITTNEVPLYIRSLLVNKKLYNIEGQDQVFIGPGVHRLDIEFSALAFSAPDLLHFKCRLVGENEEWTEFDGLRRNVSFQNLPPGQYRFEIIAANRSSIWNRSPLQLAITVDPYWWQQLWFKLVLYVAVLMLVALLSLAVADRITRNKLIRVEQMRAIEEERTRIAMDIHDQLGSEVTRVTLLCHRFIKAFQSKDWTHAPRHIHEMERVSGKLVHSLDEIVWVVRPSNDTLNNLIMYLSKYVSEMLAGTDIECELDVPFDVPEIAVAGPVRHNLYLGVKEAVNNVVKHSGATRLVFAMEYSDGCCSVQLQDNGKGIETNPDEPFHRGLISMERRMELVNGRFSISSVPDGGTVVEFKLMM